MEKRTRKRSYKRIVNFLSCLVVFCTTYALILPAATQEVEAKDVYCDQEEHTHTTDCYKSDDPLCGKEEAPVQKAHTHTDTCYETTKNLICENTEEDHEHGDDCYEEVKTLICEESESQSTEGHVHAPNCYQSSELICEKEEHIHTRECESNKSLIEERSDWEKTIPEDLYKELDKRMVQIAKTQLGYKEVKENFDIVDGTEKYYTRYGEWYGKPYQDWNTMFASFVLKYAGVPKEDIPYGHDWNDWIDDLNKKELFEVKDYEPVLGDLVFFRDQKKEDVPNQVIKSYVGIVSEAEEEKPVKAIVGDFKDEVKEVTINDKEYEIMAYIHPEISELQEKENEVPEEDSKDKEDEGSKVIFQEEEDPKDKADDESKDDEADDEKKDDTDKDVEDESKEDSDKDKDPEETDSEEKPEEDQEQKVAYRLPEQFVVETEDFTLILKPQMYGDHPYNVYSVADSAKESTDDASTKEEAEETQSENSVKMKSKVVMSEEASDNIQDKIDQEVTFTKDELAQLLKEKQEAEVKYQELPIPTVTIERVAADTDAETKQLEKQVNEASEGEDVLFTAYYRIVAYVGDQEVDLFENTRFDVELIPTQKFVDTYDTTKDLEDVKPEANVGAKLSLFTPSSSSQSSTGAVPIHASSKLIPVFKLQTSNLNEDEPNTDVELGSDENPTATMSDNILAISVNDQTNPNFTVQTWAKLEKIKEYTNSQITNFELYDQSSGISTNTKIYPNIDSNKEFETQSYYTHIYSPQENLLFHQHPELKYFNLLSDNSHYVLAQVWVLKDNVSNENRTKILSEKDSVTDANKSTAWNIYDNTVKFTNNKEYSNDNNYVVIKDNTVIRLVYEPVSIANAFTSSANFYDYDITEDGKTTNKGTSSTSKTNVRKLAQGINNINNYSGYQSKYLLGFGNQNTGTGLKLQYYNDGVHLVNNLNYGANVSLGVMTGLDSKGNPIYNNNIAVPKLFEDGDALGKTSYDGELTFNQAGDLYTITSAKVVDGQSGKESITSGLHQLVDVPAYVPKTNNFWPLDVFPGTDGLTGTKNDNNSEWGEQLYTSGIKGIIPPKGDSLDGTWNTSKTSTTEYYYPPSDNGKLHNNMFGMTYEVKFTIDEKYTGPLEYFFYGDDDLWAFITKIEDSKGNPISNPSSTLIADLGGVHVSKGTKVDLRKKHLNASQADIAGTYKLKIFYTERGLSGSTCYFRFNLPNVTGSKTDQSTQSVSITKETTDTDTTTPYTFRVNISGLDTAGIDRFDYTKIKNNNEIEQSVISSGGTITLRKDETITIRGLPIGTKVEFTELLDPSEPIKVYITSTNGIYPDEEDFDKSYITSGSAEHVYFKNVRLYTLPETGSIGLNPSIIAGGASMMTTSVYLIGMNRKGRWRSKKK